MPGFRNLGNYSELVKSWRPEPTIVTPEKEPATGNEVKAMLKAGEIQSFPKTKPPNYLSVIKWSVIKPYACK